MLYGYPVAVCTSVESVDSLTAKIIDEEELDEQEFGCIDVIQIVSDVLIEGDIPA
jgi:hypothetical protein